MSNTTDTFWEVDGVSLQTMAFNISTLGGDRASPPFLRGENLLVPAARGRRWMPKVVDQRVISLGMWVQGCTEDGLVPVGQSNRRQYDENWRKLRTLLWTPGREVTLTKRFWVAGTLKTASAKAQFASGLVPFMNGPARATFTVDLALADPYFYGPDVITNLTTGTQNVTLQGDDITNEIKIHVDGARTNVKVRNATLNTDVEYHGDVNTGAKLDIDVMKYSAIFTPSGAGPVPVSVIGGIRHTGDVSWLSMRPGTNSVVVSSSSGIGAVIMTHREVWL